MNALNSPIDYSYDARSESASFVLANALVRSLSAPRQTEIPKSPPRLSPEKVTWDNYLFIPSPQTLILTVESNGSSSVNGTTIQAEPGQSAFGEVVFAATGRYLVHCEHHNNTPGCPPLFMWFHVNLPSSLVELKPPEEGEPLLEKEPGDLTVTESPALWYTHWNSMEPIAPRPLSIRKNVTELYKTDGRWINRDPIREKGGLNLYRFISNNPIYSFDYVGINRYITHFDIAGLGGSGKTNIHVGIAVDKWIEKNGIVTYVFAALLTENSGFWSTTGNILNLLASIIIAKGKIISISGLHLESPIIMQSSPCQDIEMLSKLVEDDASPPGYNVISNSCIIWSSNAALYGMDKPGIEKCCNPDKTLFKAED